MGCLAFRPYSTRDVAEYFYGKVAYFDIKSEVSDDEICAERVLFVPAKQFLNWAVFLNSPVEVPTKSSMHV